MNTAMLETDRLILRRWLPDDRAPFARINADPVVMEFFPAPLTATQSDAMIDRIEAHFEQHGFGLYAAQLKNSGDFIGFVGLSIPAFEAHFTPCVEIGWRLAREQWGGGLATEGARAAVRHAFEDMHLPALVSFTVPANLRSIRVMQKLGMSRDPEDDFDHPRVPEGHPLRRHVLYRLTAQDVLY